MTTGELTSRSTAFADGATLIEIAAFLYQEGRLLDEHDYDAWLALWSDDGHYWVPAGGEPRDPDEQASFVNDNRSRLGMRVKQLQTGYRYAQLPQSRTQHYISNVEIAALRENVVSVRSSYLVIEARAEQVHFWPGHASHDLVPGDEGGFRIRRKTVVLINNDQAVTSMAFLL